MSVRVLAECHEAAAIGRVAAGDRSFSAHRHLPRARRTPKLLEAVREKAGTGTSRTIVAATGKEGVRTFDPDVVRIEVVRLASLDAVPLEALEKLLREGEIAVVGVEDVDVPGAQPRSLPHLACQAGAGFLVLLQRGHAAPAPVVVLAMVEDVDRFLPQVLRPLRGREDEGRA